MSELRVKIKLNKGRHGIPLQKLADVAKETEKFLEDFGHDLHLGNGEWLAEKFKNGSLSFDLVNPVPDLPEPVIHQAYEALKHVTDIKTSPESLAFGVRKSTLLQFAKIALPLSDDDSVEFGIYNSSSRPKIRTLTKRRAITIQKKISQTMRQYGAIRGRIIALFNSSCKLWVQDILTGEQITCIFEPQIYSNVMQIMRTRDAIVTVEGWSTVNQLGKVSEIKVSSIEKAPEYQEGDLEKFFGLLPDFTGELTTEDYIDLVRA